MTGRRVVVAIVTIVGASVTGPAVAAAPPPPCALAAPYQIANQGDLIALRGDAVDCSGLTFVQVADIQLDAGGDGGDNDPNEWATPITGWNGTFNGQGFEITDGDPLDDEVPLFDSPSGSVTIIDVHSNVDVTYGDGGGLIGTSGHPVTIRGSTVSGNVTGTNFVAGGLIGYTSGAATLTIVDSATSGDVSAPSAVVFSAAGGLTGLTQGSVTISNSGSSGNIVSENNTGGLIGVTSSGFTVVSSQSTGDVETSSTTGNDYAGGLIGYVSTLSGTITDSFSRATVSATVAEGGLVGYTEEDLTLTRSYFGGSATDGGLVGGESGGPSVTVTNSFCLVSSPGCGSGPFDSGKTITATNLKSSSYLKTQNWDFDETWCFRAGVNGDYPTNHCPLVFELDLDVGGSEFAIPVWGTGNVLVDWDLAGDINGSPGCRRVFGSSGSSVALDAQDVSCDYGSASGTVRIAVTGIVPRLGEDPAGPYVGADLITDVLEWGTMGTGSFDGALWGANNLTDVPGDIPATVTTTDHMFNAASSFNDDIGSWNVGQVTSMESMFSGATSFNQDIGGWNVGAVTDFQGMFVGASAFNQNIGPWDVSSAVAMYNMFLGATSFNQDIGFWDVSSVISMYGLFDGATSFDQDLSNWNTASVVDMRRTFASATAFDQDISSWNVSNVTDMNDMFDGVTLSTDNYSALLVGWSAQGVQNGVVFDGGLGTYSCSASNARGILTDVKSWTITDGGRRRCGGSGGRDVSDASPARRLGGGDRFETAALVSASVFDPGVETVYLAAGSSFADALAVGPAGAPVLLVEFGRLPRATMDELFRLQPKRIVLVGGVGVISVAVEESAKQYTTGPVVRLGGGDRFETAALVSASVFDPGVETVYLAAGSSFADALAVAPAGAPVLLVRTDCVPSSTTTELTRLRAGRIVVVGGTGVITDDVRSLRPCTT